MKNNACKDLLIEVVDEADKQFGRMWKINPDYYKVLQQYAEYFDKLSDEFEIVSFGVKVDDIKMTVEISFESPEIIVDTDMHDYTRLLMRAITVEYMQANEDYIIANHVFPSIWERA